MRDCGPRTLIENGIPCIIWAEDALEYYGVPTSVFDLFCLVEDPELAAACLRSHGFTLLGESTRKGFQFMPELIRGRPRLTDRPDQVHDEAETTAAVVLLPTSSWRYPVEALSPDTSNLFPNLSLLLQGLIDGWLDAQDLFFPSTYRSPHSLSIPRASDTRFVICELVTARLSSRVSFGVSGEPCA